jgi:hypothetical protein
MIFGSLNQLAFKTTSRRDDMISLCYMMIYILNNGSIRGIDIDAPMSSVNAFKMIQKVKREHTLITLCDKNAVKMQPFAKEVFQYKFEDQPNYVLLKKLLSEALSEQSEAETSDDESIDCQVKVDGSEDHENWSEYQIEPKVQKCYESGIQI